MNFLKKLFSGSSGQSSANQYTYLLKCNRCGETIEGHIDLSNDLSLDYEGEDQIYFVRKGLMGSGRCFQQIEVEMKFDANKQLIDRQIHGGQFVE
jgi:hypothetical protein